MQIDRTGRGYSSSGRGGRFKSIMPIERVHFRRAILDLEQVAPLVDGGGSSERLQ